jgi:ATP-dependent DNA helicase RecQ
MPIKAGDLLSVNGVGQRKLERFGAPFMAMSRDHRDNDED